MTLPAMPFSSDPTPPGVNPFIVTPVPPSNQIGPLPPADSFDGSTILLAQELSSLIPDTDIPRLQRLAEEGYNYPIELHIPTVRAFENTGIHPSILTERQMRREMWQCAAVNRFFRPVPEPFPAKGHRTTRSFFRFEPDGTQVAVIQEVESDGERWVATEVPDRITPAQRASDLDKQRPGRKPLSPKGESDGKPSKPSEKQDT